ncbi:DUF2735 domain-containing protein [Labrys wisconsinensis]|uniref:DUF2735 domain-containing protein n=1 Tax=Labrys wisconsinensis TaxID=425677 RepID=A0ABU0J063_9HYPH|nr:DUF2735 domain-containing protein [Labrys wisconsinensis]MDQ0467651.1 hypothetical protein [Labrys wisconsinensis]
MTEGTDRRSAKIYQFPPRGRVAARRRDEVKTELEAAAMRACDAASGSGWYHEAAILEERTTKH